MTRLTRKRLIVTVVVLFLLTGGMLITWEVCDWPPVQLILKYGLPPAGGPTGQRRKVEGVEFIELSAGYFRRGMPCERCARVPISGLLERLLGRGRGDDRCYDCELEWVEVPGSFYISVCEISNAQYWRHAPVGAERIRESLGRYPAVELSWSEARSYCDWLSTKGSHHARLPTEIEWEYACRAGSSGQYCFGDNSELLSQYGWSAADSENRLHPVGMLKPNKWGLLDLHGNASEWCDVRADGVKADTDCSSRLEDPAGYPILRGGCFTSSAQECRSGSRVAASRDSAGPGAGFRPVLTLRPACRRARSGGPMQDCGSAEVK